MLYRLRAEVSRQARSVIPIKEYAPNVFTDLGGLDAIGVSEGISLWARRRTIGRARATNDGSLIAAGLHYRQTVALVSRPAAKVVQVLKVVFWHVSDVLSAEDANLKSLYVAWALAGLLTRRL
jgi:hypothetical protein